MEFTHRLIAAVATISLLLLCRQRLKSYKGIARGVPIAAVALIAIVIALGGITVIKELPAQVTTIHFMTGLAVFLLAGYMAIFDGTEKPPRFSLKGHAGLFVVLGMLLYCQASLGAYVRHSDAGSACPDFPTCLGQWLPHLSGGVLVHYSHRLLAYLIVATLAAVAAAVFIDARLKRQRPAALILLTLAVIQTVIGAGVVLSGRNFAATAIHLAMALIMLLVTGRMWVAELKGDSP
jgi:heme A synthase